jgi:hypothetical protein
MLKSSVFVLALLVSVSGFAKNKHKKPIVWDNPNGTVTEDSTLVSAIESQRRVDFAEGKNMKVVDLLPDDTQGLPHQKFDVQLSDGSIMTIISNLDMCPNIPVRVGDVVGAGGQFIPTGGHSGILHWVHRDPQHRRPDGYVELNGQVYCK